MPEALGVRAPTRLDDLALQVETTRALRRLENAPKASACSSVSERYAASKPFRLRRLAA